jgi:hypothetical protein
LDFPLLGQYSYFYVLQPLNNHSLDFPLLVE